MSVNRLLSTASLALLAACTISGTNSVSTVRAKAHPPQGDGHGGIEQRFDGPGLFCGGDFALRLGENERLLRRDPGLDFLTYHVQGPDGAFLLYEGNAPQSSDDLIQMGRGAVIAIHDNRDEMAKRQSRIRDRLILRRQRSRLCGADGDSD